MSLSRNNDIGDDEIRIIHPRAKEEKREEEQMSLTESHSFHSDLKLCAIEQPVEEREVPLSYSIAREEEKPRPKKWWQRYKVKVLAPAGFVLVLGFLWVILSVRSCSNDNTRTTYAAARYDEGMADDAEYAATSRTRNSRGRDYSVSALREMGSATPDEKAMVSRGYVEVKEVTANGYNFTIYTPRDTKKAYLHVGVDALDDTTAVLMAQAADVRADNGGIVGAFVKNGILISRGDSKAGFCAIIDGKPMIGVADATSYLDRAIESGGDFFRQFPLVVGGQVVENDRPGKALRKALVEINGDIAIVSSREKLTFNEFSKALVSLGVANAIYLVGSTSYGTYRTSDGSRRDFGERVEDPYPNASYIIWK